MFSKDNHNKFEIIVKRVEDFTETTIPQTFRIIAEHESDKYLNQDILAQYLQKLSLSNSKLFEDLFPKRMIHPLAYEGEVNIVNFFDFFYQFRMENRMVMV